MKPAAFDYQRLDSAEAVAATLAELGDDARILAGGQSLMAVLNMRLAQQPQRLIDISRSTSMAEVRIDGNCLLVGAAATQAAVERRLSLAVESPLLALAFPNISHQQIRSRGTVVGSIAHADPAAELPLCLVALDGEVVLRSRQACRVLKAGDFFTGMLSTARQPDELIEAVRIPLAARSAGHGFAEFSRRPGDFAICSVAAIADDKRLRIAIGGVADRPTLRDLPILEGESLVDALNDLAWAMQTIDEPQASAALRRQLVRELGRRAAAQALQTRSST